ncbi:hypothetical protein [Serratia sp. ser-z]
MTEVLTYETLKAERDALADKCDRLEYNLGNAIVGEQEALQRVNALAVENVALKESLESICNAYNEELTDLLDIAVKMAVKLQTPATDAALAAIRNEATERVLKHLCDCQLISATVAELKADELREAK